MRLYTIILLLLTACSSIEEKRRESIHVRPIKLNKCSGYVTVSYTSNPILAADISEAKKFCSGQYKKPCLGSLYKPIEGKLEIECNELD